MMVRKGENTKQNILSRALLLASQVGLEGLSIGGLATALNLSKSGLFAHFQSKESLQIQVLETAAQVFTEHVIRPALGAPRGEPRVRALFENWLKWASSERNPGGCIFVSAAAELDDRPGPVRDRLLRISKDWLNTRIRIAMTGVEKGHFRSDLDPEQFAYELYAIMLAFHHASRLLRDPKAENRARRAFENLVQASHIGKAV